MWVHNRDDRDKPSRTIVDVDKKETIKVNWRGKELCRQLEVKVLNEKTQVAERTVHVLYNYKRSRFKKWLMNNTPIRNFKNPVVVDDGDRVIIYDTDGKEITNEELIS